MSEERGLVNLKATTTTLGTLLFVAATLTSTACSNSQGYEKIRESNRKGCNKLPGNQREACLDSVATDRDNYRRQREEAMSGSKDK